MDSRKQMVYFWLTLACGHGRETRSRYEIDEPIENWNKSDCVYCDKCKQKTHVVSMKPTGSGT